jgi:acyl-CoA synthetase (AMP-forming)/AMP-acid ligase II
MERWDAAATLDLVAEHRVTHTHMVPTMFHRLLALPDDVRAAADTSSLFAVIHGAAEGARASIGGFTDAERAQLARNRVNALLTGYQPLLNPARATVTTADATSNGRPAYRVSVAYPVSEVTVAGKLTDLYLRIQRGSDLEFRGAFNVPSLMFDAVAIAGK